MYEFLIILTIAFCSTVFVYLYPYKSQLVKTQEDSSKYIVLIYFIRFVHYCTFTFSIIYPFVFDKQYDVYYLIFGILLYISWKVHNGECILSLWEKQLLDPEYIAGSDSTYNPYIDCISHDFNRFLFVIMWLSYLFVFIRFVLYILSIYIK